MDILKKLNYIFSKEQKIKFLILLVIILTGAVLELVSVAMVMPLVTSLIDSNHVANSKIMIIVCNMIGVTGNQQRILLLIAGLIGAFLIKNIYLIFMYDCQYRYTYNNKRKTAIRLMNSYMGMPYIFHLSKNISEIQRNMKEDVDNMFTAVLASIQALAELLTCILIAIYLILLDKYITFAVSAVLVLFIFVFLRLTKNKTLRYGKITRNAVADINKWIRQSFEGIKEIKVSDSEAEFISKVDEAYYRHSMYTRKQEVMNSMPRPVFETVCISSLLGVVWVEVALNGEIYNIIPILSVFVVAAVRLLPSFGRLTGYINRITYNVPSIDNVYMDLKNAEKTDAISVIDNNKDSIDFSEKIDINNLVFSYPNCSDRVLDGASVSIKKGESIAIIGSSGNGKSTFADILTGVLVPQEGTIQVDGVDIFTRLSGWHRLLGYIPQSIYLLDDTIRNNITFGIMDPSIDENKVWRALESAQLAEFVRELEQGLDTVVGERGVRLSGGQKQRVGIARALLSNPQVLILDEATSALDNETETSVMEAIESLRESHTIIIIAHRLNTVKNCSKIYEIKDGKAIKRDIAEVIK